MNKILHANNLSKIYGTGKNEFLALDKINLDIIEGEFVCIMGPSGSGKSTLLYELSTVDIPELGLVEIAGVNVRGMHEVALGHFRSQNLGFIFQEFNLIDCLTIRENIALPLTLHMKKAQDIEKRVVEVASKLGVESLLDRFPNECSGGQRQRVASARALIANPKLVVADEPSGNLDSKNSHELLKLLTELNEKDKITILMVTHDAMIASYAKKLLFLKDGKIEQEVSRGALSRKEFFYQIMDITSSESQAMFETEVTISRENIDVNTVSNLSINENISLAKSKTLDLIVSITQLEGHSFSKEEIQTIISGKVASTLTLQDIILIHDLHHTFLYLLEHINQEVNYDLIQTIHSLSTRQDGLTQSSFIEKDINTALIKNEIKEILSIENQTLKALELMNFILLSNLFKKGNIRVALLLVNYVLIQQGLGLLLIHDVDTFTQKIEKMMQDKNSKVMNEYLISLIINQ